MSFYVEIGEQTLTSGHVLPPINATYHTTMPWWVISITLNFVIICINCIEVLRCCGVLEYSLDSRAESPGSSLTIATALLSFSKAIYPHCCSRPRCINGDPVGCDRLLCLNLPVPLSQAAIQGKEYSQGSGNCALLVRHEMYPVTGVIIIYCKRFAPFGKSAYKNQVLLLLLLLLLLLCIFSC